MMDGPIARPIILFGRFPAMNAVRAMKTNGLVGGVLLCGASLHHVVTIPYFLSAKMSVGVTAARVPFDHSVSGSAWGGRSYRGYLPATRAAFLVLVRATSNVPIPPLSCVLRTDLLAPIAMPDNPSGRPSLRGVFLLAC